MKIPALSAFYKPYIDEIRKILSKKIVIEPAVTDLSITLKEIEDEEKLIKSAFNEDIIGLDEYLTALENIKKKKENLKPQKQSYADAIIKNENGEILLLRRSITDSFHPDSWSLPGGKIEKDETPEQAVIREVKEETNLNVSSATLILKKKIDSGNIYYFTCEVTNTPIETSIILVPEEHISIDFADRSKWSEMNLILDLEDTLNEIVGESTIDYDLFPTYLGPDGKRYIGYSNIEEKIANENKDTFMLSLLTKSEIEEEEYVDYINKAHSSPNGLVKLDGKDKKGYEQSKWVTKTDLKLLAKHAKNTPQKDLEATIKEHPSTTVREHAHKELDRREKEEAPQDKEKTGYEAHEYHGKEFKYDSKTDSHLDDEGTKANPTKLYEYYNQRHKEQSTQLDAIKGDLETSTKQKQALNNKLVKAYYDKIKKTRFVGDEKSAYDVSILKLEKVGLQKEDIDDVKLKKIISKKINKK